jgi:hypothetical protein
MYIVKQCVCEGKITSNISGGIIFVNLKKISNEKKNKPTL